MSLQLIFNCHDSNRQFVTTDLPNIIEISVWHHLLSLQFFHFIEHHVQLETGFKVAQTSVAIRFSKSNSSSLCVCCI